MHLNIEMKNYIDLIDQTIEFPTREFNINDVINTPYDTQSMQPALFCANSYNQMINETSEWLNKIS